jgi:hypothetical protein
VGVLHELLAQCRQAELYGVQEVNQVAPPRKGTRPTYDIWLRRQRADGRTETTGVVVVMEENANAVTGFFRRLLEDDRPLDRVVVVSDARVGLPLGERGQELLERLAQRGPERFAHLELSFAEYVELEALQKAGAEARGGNIEVEARPGEVRSVALEEVVASHHRQGRYLASRLLRELLGPPPASEVVP